MPKKIKILAFAGSARPGSYNAQLVRIAGRAAESAGAEVTYLDLSEISLPLFDQHTQINEGFPDAAVQLKELMPQQDGFLFSSPEYNASIAAPMKNMIDWVSRSLPGEGWKICFAGKAAAIMCASTGGLGGLRSLAHMRDILSAMHVLVLPQQVTVGNAKDAFSEDGGLNDADLQERTEALGTALVELLQGGSGGPDPG
ncbi:MAG: NAD(P)H-dependent oxidoreductase [Pseudomonadota bacterium]